MFGPRLSLLSVVCLLLLPRLVPAGERDKEVRAEELYRLDLRARKPAEKEMPRDRRPVAVHVFLDRDDGRLFYVADGENVLAVVAAGKDAGKSKDKTPRLSHRLLLPVRTSDEEKFSEGIAKRSVEVYRDENNGNLVYLTPEGAIAVVAGVKPLADKTDRGTKWLGRLRMKVREHSDDFGQATLHCSVEVYRDENTGCVIYAADKGGIAALAIDKAGEAREAEWTHAVTFKARAPSEDDFTEKTTAFDAEVYFDESRDTFVYVTPSFRLAVVPARRKVAAGDKIEAPRWERRVRSKVAGAGKWSAEEFFNPNTGDRLFVTAGGALAALPASK
jgi:hypothetical protein